MPIRLSFILFNYLMAILGAVCLVLADLFALPLGETAILALVILCWMECKRQIPVMPPAWFSLVLLSIISLPALYFLLSPEIPNLLAGFLLFIMVTRFIFKAEFNDYLYGHLISIVCLLVGALFIQDITFAFLFLAFFLVMCWGLIFYNLMAEQVGSRSPPELFRTALINARLNSGILGLTTALVLGSLVLTSIIFISFPRMGLGLVSLDNGGVPISGFSDRVQFGDVGRLKQNEAVVLRIRFSKNNRPYQPRLPALWRGVALDHFDGTTWSSTLPQFWSNSHRPGQPMTLFSMKPEENVIGQEIYMENIDTPVVFTYGLPLSIDGTFTELAMDSAFSFKTTDKARGPRRFDTMVDIGPAEKRIAYPLPGQLDNKQRQQFLQRPELSQEIQKLVAQLTRGIASDREKAAALMAYLGKGFSYSLEMKETNRSYLDEFLFHRRAGHCEYFATALTIMLREAGIPARLVNGFMGVEWNEMGGYMIVRQIHAHSWVEAFFPDQGWVSFDPTPPDPGTATESPSRFSLYMDLLRLNWQRYVVKYNLSDQIRIADFVEDKTRNVMRGFRSLSDLSPQSILPFLKQHGFIILIGALTLWLLITLFIKFRKSRLPENLKPTPATLQYNRMLSRLEKKGVVKAANWTPREFIAQLDSLDPEDQASVESITHLYEKSRFGGNPLEEDEEQFMKEQVTKL